METRNFQIRFCPKCGATALPGHQCNADSPAVAVPVDAAPSSHNSAEPAEASTASSARVAGAAPATFVPPDSVQLPPPLRTRQRRSLGQILLDPRSIRWLLGSGGVLLVTGLVIWLASLGVFDNPLVVATLLGAGTLALLGSGWSVIRFTRFNLAGKALTLLACLVMPLNLWFYQSNQLLTFENSLWVPAVICCALYAASALVLKDPLFVFVLMGGIAGTGLLILADMHKFAEIAAPSMMLVVMGLLGIHAERAFPESETVFSRKRFGLAFFFSGHALLGAGLLLLLGAQAAAWIVHPLLPHWNIISSDITTDPTLRFTAIALVLAGTYGYVWSEMSVRRIGAYIYPAVFTLLWAELLGLQMLQPHHGTEMILAAVSLTALALNAVHALLSDTQARAGRHLAPLAVILSVLPVGFGLLLHLRATFVNLNQMWPYTIGYGYVGAMVIAAVACRIGAFVQRRDDSTSTWCYHYLTGAATLLAAAGLLAVNHVQVWSSQLPILMLIPIGYVIASRIHRVPAQREALISVAQAATAAMLFSAFVSATHLSGRVFQTIQGHSTNLLLATFFAEAAIFYATVAAIRRRGRDVFLSVAMTAGAMWQLLSYYQAGSSAIIIAFALLGLVLVIVSRFLPMTHDTMRPSIESGHALLTISFLSSSLKVLSHLLGQTLLGRDRATMWAGAELLGVMMLITLIASIAVGKTSWRRAYLMMTLASAAIAGLLLALLGHMTFWQKTEIFASLCGLALLIFGHIGWYREQSGHNDTVSFNLSVGAWLAGAPLLIAAIIHRFGAGFSLPDEMALLTVSTLMLVSGFMLELRSTTIAGAALLLAHLAMLLTSAGLEAQLALGVELSIGGGAIFLTGLFLAIYRDRLAELPEKIHRREGMFRVLAWR